MQITRTGAVGIAAAVVDRKCNSSTCSSKLLLTSCSSDFRTCLDGSDPFEVAMPFGLGGSSIKITQPLKNGGDDIEGKLALWWQGDMEPTGTMHFLRFNLAEVLLLPPVNDLDA